MIHQLAFFKVFEDKVEEAIDAIKTFVNKVNSHETDTILYRSLQQKNDPAIFIHYMIFKDEAAESFHKKTEWVEQFVKVLYPLCKENPTFVKYNEILD